MGVLHVSLSSLLVMRSTTLPKIAVLYLPCAVADSPPRKPGTLICLLYCVSAYKHKKTHLTELRNKAWHLIFTYSFSLPSEFLNKPPGPQFADCSFFSEGSMAACESAAQLCLKSSLHFFAFLFSDSHKVKRMACAYTKRFSKV